MNILQTINSHEDLLAVSEDDIPRLCQEIRDFLLEKVSASGGHLASNLGIVELTVALHRVYDPMVDRILFDVGHQSYVHKILTGRREEFDDLRKFGGISGFPRPCESEADPFLAGHASDSISAGIGMARARSLLHEKKNIVVVIGDGAMTGGVSFEGLSDAGASGEPIVVVLNDNGMSISRNVGGVAHLLSRARLRPAYIHFKRVYRRVMQRRPQTYNFFHRIKERIKTKLIPPGIFDAMGFYYIGPVDGHNEADMELMLRWAKELKQPVLIHCVTQKGKGYAPAENDPELYHGVGSFDPAVGVAPKSKKDFSSCFGDTLLSLAESDRRICAVTAAMESGTGLEQFAKRFPEQYFELGIAEEHAAAMCAGMAKQGLKPVFAVYSSFLQRSYDMLLENIGLMNNNVVFAVDRAGIVGQDGVTHQGSFDVAFLKSVPGMKIYAPSSFAELNSMLTATLHAENGPAAIRYPRGGEGEYSEDNSAENTVVMHSGNEVTLVTHGILLNNALEACRMLERKGHSVELIKINRLYPLDADPILASLRKTKRLVSLEDNCRFGSVSENVLAECGRSGIPVHTCRQIDLEDGAVPHGSVSDLRKELHMDAESVANILWETIHEKDPS